MGLKPGVRCDECGNLLFGWYTSSGDRLFCSYGCQERYERREKQYEEEQAAKYQAEKKRHQAEQQRIREEAHQLFPQRLAAMGRDPRSKDIAMLKPIVYATDADVLKEYISRYGDPLRNPSLMQPKEPPPPTGQAQKPRKNFFDDDPEESTPAGNKDQEAENLIEVFTKLAVASMADDMKTMLLEGKIDSAILCRRALSKLLSLPNKTSVSRQVVDLILAFGDFDQQSKHSIWPDIIRFGIIELAQQALDRGAAIDADPNDKTALILAIEEQDLDMVRFLLEQGADPNYFHSNFFADNEGIPPLAIAERDGLEEISALLRKHINS